MVAVDSDADATSCVVVDCYCGRVAGGVRDVAAVAVAVVGVVSVVADFAVC